MEGRDGLLCTCRAHLINLDYHEQSELEVDGGFLLEWTRRVPKIGVEGEELVEVHTVQHGEDW
jgi:hypothetical protein